MEDLDKVVLDPKDNILDVNISIEELKARIAKLSGLPKDNLKGEMGRLKLCLRANPEISNLLLPEEIGELVKAIYKMTDQVVIASAAKATTKASKKIDVSKLTSMPADF